MFHKFFSEATRLPSTLRWFRLMLDSKRAAATGRFMQAETLILAGLEEAEKPPTNRMFLAQTLHVLGELHAKEKEWAKAEVPLQRALSIREEILAPNSRVTAQTLELLAFCCLAQGKDDAAETLYLRIMTMRESLGPSWFFAHLEQFAGNASAAVRIFNRLAHVYEMRGKSSERILLYIQTCNDSPTVEFGQRQLM